MPREVHNALTPAKVRQEKQPGRYADGNGLYLHVSETGARWWLWRGTVHGKRCERGMGSARLTSASAGWRASLAVGPQTHILGLAADDQSYR